MEKPLLLTRFTVFGLSLVALLVSGAYLPAVWAVPMFVVAVALSASVVAQGPPQGATHF